MPRFFIISMDYGYEFALAYEHRGKRGTLIRFNHPFPKLKSWLWKRKHILNA